MNKCQVITLRKIDEAYHEMSALTSALQTHKLMLRYSIADNEFSMSIDKEEAERLAQQNSNSYYTARTVAEKLFNLLFRCNCEQLARIEPYAYGWIQLTPGCNSLEVKLMHHRKHERCWFHTTWSGYPVINHHVLATHLSIEKGKPVEIKSLEEMCSVMVCLDIQELIVKKNTTDSQLLMKLNPVQAKGKVGTLISSYLKYGQDLDPLKIIAHLDRGQLLNSAELALDFHQSGTNSSINCTAKAIGYFLVPPNEPMYKEYLIRFKHYETQKTQS